MFADPAVLTVNGVAKSLVRVNQDKYSSEYMLRSATDEYRLFIRNVTRTEKSRNSVKIDRHTVDFTHVVFPVAPATTSTVRKVYTVIENQQGDTLTDPIKVAVALLAFLTEAKITQLTNFES